VTYKQQEAENHKWLSQHHALRLCKEKPRLWATGAIGRLTAGQTPAAKSAQFTA